MSTNRCIRNVARVVGAAAVAVGAIALTGVTASADPPDVDPTATAQCFSLVPTPAEAALPDPDAGDSAVTPVDVPAGSAADFQGDIERTWTFVGGDRVQVITVEDTTPPEATAPPAVTVVGAADIPAPQTIAADDNCDGSIDSAAPTDEAAPGGTDDDQTITRTWEATDNAGNVTTVTQTITVVPATADLALTVTPNPNPVAAGSALVYTVAVENIGPAPATEVTVVTAAPTGATTSGCTNDPAGAAGCTLGDIAVGATASYTVTVAVASNATGPLAQTWTVSATSPDPVPSNDSVDTAVDVVANATMTIAAAATVTELPSTTATTAAGATGTPGNPAAITITVGNNGPSDASNAVVTATFAAGVSGLTVAESAPYVCEIVGQLLTCTSSVHPAAQTAPIQLRGTVTAGTSEVFDGPVRVDSDQSEVVSATGAVVVVPAETTTTSTATTTSTTTTTVAEATDGSGDIAATGSDSNVILRVSLIALLAGLAAIIIARRRPGFATARPSRVGLIASHDADTARSVARATAGGVSTVIEEPRRSSGRQ